MNTHKEFFELHGIWPIWTWVRQYRQLPSLKLPTPPMSWLVDERIVLSMNLKWKHTYARHSIEAVENRIKYFTQMSQPDCKLITSLIEPSVKRMDTRLWEVVTVTESLIITLRFLATGYSYTSLQYLFRVSKHSISRIEIYIVQCPRLEILHDIERIC